MTENEKFSKRLRAAMKKAGLEGGSTELKTVFNSRWTGTPIRVQSAWSWLNGRALPRQDKLLVLAQILNVDPSELQFGTRGSAPPSSSESLPTYAERETIESFLRLPAKQREIVREVIMAFAKVARKARQAPDD